MTNKRLITLLAFIFIAAVVYAQPKANYRLASKYSPKKLDKIVYSLNVDPHWLKNGNRFWYVYETNQGKKWYIVDANKGEKKYLFDNDKMAAEISKIVKDPFDAQNLGLDSIRFIGDETKFQFEVKSTEEIEKKDTTAKDKKDAKPIKEKKVFYFEYDINTGLVTELQGFK
ncbi:MAG TPA: hypothetical protein PKG56_08485, partial [Chitinophagaceae bacterium]|nr:hypothetical protein [Chitinophagaceae bacterium]